VSRLYEAWKMARFQCLLLTVTIQWRNLSFDNPIWSVRNSLVDAIRRATMWWCWKVASCRLDSDVGKRCCASWKAWSSVDYNRSPIQSVTSSGDGWICWLKWQDAVKKKQISLVTATVIRIWFYGDVLQTMKDKAILCNIGHFDNEIDMAVE